MPIVVIYSIASALIKNNGDRTGPQGTVRVDYNINKLFSLVNYFFNFLTFFLYGGTIDGN